MNDASHGGTAFCSLLASNLHHHRSILRARHLPIYPHGANSSKKNKEILVPRDSTFVYDASPFGTRPSIPSLCLRFSRLSPRRYMYIFLLKGGCARTAVACTLFEALPIRLK